MTRTKTRRRRSRKGGGAMEVLSKLGPSGVATAVTAVSTGVFFAFGLGWIALFSGLVMLANLAFLAHGTQTLTRKPKRKPAPRLPAKPRATRVLEGKIVPGRTRVGLGARTCNARCKTSRLPKSTCRCVCGGRTHGSLR